MPDVTSNKIINTPTTRHYVWHPTSWKTDLFKVSFTVVCDTRKPAESVSLAHCDPGVVFRCGHELIPGLHHLAIEALQPQPAHQRAQQHRRHCVRKSVRGKKEWKKHVLYFCNCCHELATFFTKLLLQCSLLHKETFWTLSQNHSEIIL